jgi:hypothetical protein
MAPGQGSEPQDDAPREDEERPKHIGREHIHQTKKSNFASNTGRTTKFVPPLNPTTKEQEDNDPHPIALDTIGMPAADGAWNLDATCHIIATNIRRTGHAVVVLKVLGPGGLVFPNGSSRAGGSHVGTAMLAVPALKQVVINQFAMWAAEHLEHPSWCGPGGCLGTVAVDQGLCE